LFLSYGKKFKNIHRKVIAHLLPPLPFLPVTIYR
jgi:hypothetical protein